MAKRSRKPKKVLWVSDAVATTGFARVSHSVIKNLPKGKYDVHHIGINYLGDPHEYDHKIYPAMLGGDLYGTRRLVELSRIVKPDLIFFLNDSWIIDQYLDELKNNDITDIPIVVYFPIDSTNLTKDWFKNYHLVYETCVYTQFGKNAVIDSEGLTKDHTINVVPHGVDTKVFYPYEDKGVLSGSDLAKRELLPVDKSPELQDCFVILNANRNQPRKRIDLTLLAFAQFIKGKEGRVRLYCHMGIEDAGINILRVAGQYDFDDQLIVSTLENQIPGVPDDRLNLIYNACDVGINTSTGEGWGLVSFEHAATRKAQIVPDHSASAELWSEESAYMVDSPEPVMYDHISTLARVPSLGSIVDAMEDAYEDWLLGNLDEKAEAAYELVTQEKYTWTSVARQFDEIFTRVLGK